MIFVDSTTIDLYVAAAGGVWMFASDGELIGVIRTPKRPANCAWGGNEWRTLFITARESLYNIGLNVPGVKCPR